MESFHPSESSHLQRYKISCGSMLRIHCGTPLVFPSFATSGINIRGWLPSVFGYRTVYSRQKSPHSSACVGGWSMSDRLWEWRYRIERCDDNNAADIPPPFDRVSFPLRTPFLGVGYHRLPSAAGVRFSLLHPFAQPNDLLRITMIFAENNNEACLYDQGDCCECNW